MAETTQTTITNPDLAGVKLGEIGAAPAQQMQRQQREAEEPKGGWWWGTGRRKRAVARARIKPNPSGEGTIKVQISKKAFKSIDEYFCEERDRNDCYAPLKVAGLLGKMDVVVRCNGGGFMGQAQAVRLGIARAVRAFDPTSEDVLREHGYLTVDARKVERKKYGQAGARRRFQFSKR